MSEPWKETWRQSEAYPNDVFGEDGGDVLFEGNSLDGWSVNMDEVCARAKLAAAAPEMARLLLDLEWSGVQWDYGGNEAMCITCSGRPPMQCHDGTVMYGTHDEDCRWAAALRKAGVLSPGTDE